MVLGFEFLLEEPDLTQDGLALDLRAPDLLFQRGNAVAQHGEVAFHVLAPSLEGQGLLGQSAGHVRIGGALQKGGRDGDARILRDLGAQPRLHGGEPVVADEEPPQLRTRRGLVQAQQDLARLHRIAFPNPDLADHPALQMLKRLVLAGRHEAPGGDDSPGDGSRAGPDAESPDQQAEEREAADRQEPRVVRRADRPVRRLPNPWGGTVRTLLFAYDRSIHGTLLIRAPIVGWLRPDDALRWV